MGTTGCALIGEGAGRRSECTRISDLSRSGEHKPAVDASQDLVAKGGSCSPHTMEAVEQSRSKLKAADSYVHKALKRRKEGNLLSARANLQEALRIYPRYYWVQTLLKNVERSIRAELDSLKNEASYLESIGDPEAALSRITDALKLAPGDQELKAEVGRLKTVIGKVKSEKSVKNLLEEARFHLEEGRFDKARQLLITGNAPRRLGSRGEELLAEIAGRRQEHVRRRFNLAVDKEKEGDMAAAAGHTLYVLEMSAAGEDLSGRIVEFARLLGMKFYSAGEFTRAKEIWTSALLLEPGNLKLQGYLKEVESRLDNLDRIKMEGTENLEK